MKNGKTWILVTDSSKARLYSIQKAKFLKEPTKENLELINEYNHEKSREYNHDLVTDRGGLYNNRNSKSGASSWDPPTLPKVHEFEVFATYLAKQLEMARNEMEFRDLILVAPSHFMGLMNKHIPTTLDRLISQRIEKDYAHFNENELIPMLVKHF